jgi:hypothetical protein
MMYSTGNGQRKIRVINFEFDVTANFDHIYDRADYLAMANVRSFIFRFLPEIM